LEPPEPVAAAPAAPVDVWLDPVVAEGALGASLLEQPTARARKTKAQRIVDMHMESWLFLLSIPRRCPEQSPGALLSNARHCRVAYL
jgi:hypothetical protein